METEVIILQNTDALDVKLQSENVTDAVIEKLRTDYSGLAIAGLDDKKGYNAVDAARKEVKRIRLVAEKICDAFVGEAHSVHKQRTAKRKEILSRFEEIETSLAAKQKVIDDAKAKIAAEEERKRREKMDERVSLLAKYGDPTDRIIVEGMTDDQFVTKLEGVMKAWEEAEHKKQQEADALEKQRKEQEAERLRLEKIEADQRAAQKKIDDERAALEKEKKDAEDARLREIEAKKRAEELEAAKKEAAAKAVREAEEKAKREAEAKEEADRKAAAEVARIEALKPEKERLKAWVASFDLPELAIKPIAPEGHAAVTEIHAKFTAFKKWATEQAESIK